VVVADTAVAAVDTAAAVAGQGGMVLAAAVRATETVTGIGTEVGTAVGRDTGPIGPAHETGIGTEETAEIGTAAKAAAKASGAGVAISRIN
jgi:hypothetical protein